VFTIRLVVTVSIALVVGSPAVSAGASAPTSPPIAGSIGVRLVDAPTAAVSDPRAQIYIVDHLAPGSVITRRVEVSNGSAATARIALYSSAASIVQGSFIGAASNTANDLSNWTTITPSVTDIIAGGLSIATVTIAVPADAAPGEQYGVVWAQVRSDQAAGGITQISRVGIRLYVSVGPGGPPPANFTIESLTALRSSNGVPSIVAKVRNTGGRALDMSGTVRLAGGPGGLNAGPFPVELGVTLAIGAAELVTTTLDTAMPAGPWHVTITLHSGLVERSADASLTFPTVGAGPAVPALSPQSGSGAVATVGAVIVGVAVVSGSSFRVRRRRRRSLA
jgi:hypothetical protein